MNKPTNFKKHLQALPGMGMTGIVLGVLLLASTFVFNLKSNTLLFAGLLFIVLGTAGYVYSLKK